jgi:hypothetical protein
LPKLDTGTAQRVQKGADNADSGEFEPLPEGVYRLSLRSVTVKTLEQSKEPKLVGCPMWVWEFEIPEGNEHAGRRFWTQRILPADNGYQHADFMMAKFAEPFEALGGSVNDDTDDLLGNVCRGFVTQQIATRGKREGQPTNSLEDLLPDGDIKQPGKADAEDDYDF